MGAAVVVELGEQVGGVVGLHTGDQVGELVVVAVLGELELVLVAELFEQVGFELGVVLDGGDDFLALPVRRGLDEVGELGRVEAGELRVRDAQPDGRDVAGERLEARPVEEVGDADPRRDRPREQAPEQALRADVDPDDAPPAFDAGDLDLVRAHEPGAVDVDQLPVEEVLAAAAARPRGARTAAGRAALLASVIRPCSISPICSAGTKTSLPATFATAPLIGG